MDERAPDEPAPHGAATLAPRLAGEMSPYLRAHAHNPVDWYPWGAEALERARREDRPILLSVGYAACHWCHVMAHESFENPDTAARMNALYVNIKVDREERPDLDRLYQLAQHLLTGRSGGWPLTMFLLPEDQRPFFGGTYFPPQAKFGLPGFREVLEQVATYYHAHRDALRDTGAQVVQALDSLSRTAPQSAALNDEPLRQCRQHLEQHFDTRYGGFGPAPKFPQAGNLALLLRSWPAHSGQMVEQTLTCMAEGGLFDQLGGGFFRYSVDERWEIPHFEKMLYDNAQLLDLYAEAAAVTGRALFRDTALQTAQFLLRELRAPEGAFYSSLDADSEGQEGRFYVWDREQVSRVLSPAQDALFAAAYGLDGPPNFEGDWHLRVRIPAERLAEQRHAEPETVRAALAAARERLFEQRATRIRPGLDDKVLTSWNALTIGALASAARHLRNPTLVGAASEALEYLRRHHWRQGRLLAVGAAGRAQLPGYLDDHAFLIEAILELSSARFDSEALHWAIELAELLLAHFEDRDRGGFYFTADDQEALMSRPKSFADEALPSGNAVAARALLRLGYLLAEPRYLQAAERTLRAAWASMRQYPEAHASLLSALETLLAPPRIVLLRGPAATLPSWQRALDEQPLPRTWTLAIPAEVTGLPAGLAAKAAGPQPLGYICQGTQCSAPCHSLTTLLAAVRAPESPARGRDL